MASSPQSPSSANDVLTSHSSNHPDPHMSSSSSDNQDHTSASPSQDHCRTSLSAVDKNCQTSPSPDTDESNLTSPSEETLSIAGASILETTKPPQSRLGFLSLPPEIRNMIYSFLFTPVQDGTCWGVRAKFMDASLSGVRLPCYICSNGSIHTFCRFVDAPQDTTHTTYTAFTLTNKHMHSNIHQTCRTIMKESRASSLAHMLISIDCIFNHTRTFHQSFNRFLVNMDSPTEAYLAGLSCTSLDGSGLKYKPEYYLSLSTFINEKRIKIGYFELKECWFNGVQPSWDVLEFFVDFLQSLDHKPATVRWQKGDFRSDPSYKDEMNAFNNVVGAWLEATSISKAKGSGLKMPLLRDFLPKYFDRPQT
ncbi:hypothetical protein D6D15_10440 [Aureobasidium pullulans]|uniref:Uncharacterized protein n=1 Tax=Aureobasidium pullulans TaxID=5580 RepID=A0A4S9APZ4_AURPU|nr:hypothetical protein D6D15_10440 [Aureobasidium pullulans]